MGSLCQTSPQKTSTSTTQTYTPAGQAGMQDIYNRVASAASTPYTAYSGQLVAGLDPVQQAGISNINNAYGMAQPYYNQAQNYATQGASNITPDQIEAYTSPYTKSVINATQANFNESNAQQQSQLRGNAALRGALGGDRAGVAGAELARQQNLSQAPVIANLQQQGYTSALGAAQADRAAKAQGAFTMGSIGSAAQNAALQGGNAQIGAGAVAQQNQQQQLGADYQKYLNAQAFPYQQAQFYSSYGLPALQAQGGTTAGQSQSTVQPPAASPFSQVLGAGLTAAGLFTGNPFMGMSGLGSMFGGGGSGGGPISTYNGGGVNPWMSAPGGFGSANMTNWADGGAVTPFRTGLADGGIVSPFQINYTRGGSVADHFHSIRGMLRQHYDEGGIVRPLDLYRGAIGGMESSNRYDALGPMIAKTGDQALGKYGIMGNNLDQWSRAALGRPVSREEFLKSPQLQDAIFNHRFGSYVDKYGPSGAARAWFAGPGGMNNMNASDRQPGFRGNTVAQYQDKFNRAIGIPDSDRARLAAMSSAPMNASQILYDNNAPTPKDFGMDARKRAIAMGLAMMTGGGSGFAYGGPVNKEFGGGMSIVGKDNPLSFNDRWSEIPGALIPGISPNQRVQESHAANGPLDNPSDYMNMGKKMLGQQPNSPYQVMPENNWPSQNEEEGPQEANETQEAENQEQPRDPSQMQFSSQDRRTDPYSVYQQNLPKGSSGDDIRSALVAAGLGMMAGRSSNALTNIGEGGLRGLTQYNINKKERQNAEMQARRLMQQAEQFNQSLDLKNDQFNRQSENDARREAMFDRRLQQQEKLAREREERSASREQWKPIGNDPEGNPILLNQKDGTYKVATGANIAPKPSEEQKLIVKNDLKRLDDVRKEAAESNELIDSSKRALAALPEAYTGYRAAVGNAINDNPTVAVRKEVNKLTLESGQKMKGSFSDRDITFLKEMLGGKFANREVLQQGFEGIQAAAQRSQSRVDFYEQYRAKNKTLQGVDNAWNHYLAANPIIEPDKKSSTGYRINTDNARADYNAYLKPIPSWVPKGAVWYDEDKKQYRMTEKGEIKSAQ